MTNLFEFYTSLLQKNLDNLNWDNPAFPTNSNKISLPLTKLTLKFIPTTQISLELELFFVSLQSLSYRVLLYFSSTEKKIEKKSLTHTQLHKFSFRHGFHWNWHEVSIIESRLPYGESENAS